MIAQSAQRNAAHRFGDEHADDPRGADSRDRGGSKHSIDRPRVKRSRRVDLRALGFLIRCPSDSAGVSPRFDAAALLTRLLTRGGISAPERRDRWSMR